MSTTKSVIHQRESGEESFRTGAVLGPFPQQSGKLSAPPVVGDLRQPRGGDYQEAGNEEKSEPQGVHHEGNKTYLPPDVERKLCTEIKSGQRWVRAVSEDKDPPEVAHARGGTMTRSEGERIVAKMRDRESLPPSSKSPSNVLGSSIDDFFLSSWLKERGAGR